MSNRFTERAQRIIMVAQEEAKRLNHDYVGTEHLLLAIVALGEGVASSVLDELGVDPKLLRDAVEKVVGVGNGMILGDIPFTPRAKKVLEFAVEESVNAGQAHVGTEHLLLALIREEEGVAAQVLEHFGVGYEDARDTAKDLLEEVPEPNAKLKAAAVAHAKAQRIVTITVTRPGNQSLILTDVKHYSFVQAMVHVEMKDGSEYYVSQEHTLIHDKRTHQERYGY